MFLIAGWYLCRLAATWWRTLYRKYGGRRDISPTIAPGTTINVEDEP
jgi:hypothetical protein